MTMWYVNRSAGLVSWALLSASVIFGLLLSSKVMGKAVKPNWLQDLHRGLSGLAVIFVAVHVAGAIGDNFIHFGALDVTVPFASSWRPTAIAWGVVSMYLVAAVEITSLLRKRIPKAMWRKVHFLSFPLFLTATAHGITAGTDMAHTAGIVVAATVTAIIAGLTTLRVIDEMDKAKNPPAPRVPVRSARPASTPAATARPPASPAPFAPAARSTHAPTYQPHTFSVPAPAVPPTIPSEGFDPRPVHRPTTVAPRPGTSF